MKKIVIAAVFSSVATMLFMQHFGHASEVARQVKLENERVEVTERMIPPGAAREPYVRGTDQVIVFLNDAEYDRIDPVTGQKTTRKRKAGDAIWHSRGELAPKLINVGATPFRSLVIALKTSN